MAAKIVTLANGLGLEVDSKGPSSRTAVLLVSGAGAPMQFWPDGFVDDLVSAGYLVIRYCHRDTGLSDHFDTKYSALDLLEDLRLLLLAQGIQSAHFVGHSMGGFLCLLAMLEMPGMVLSATAVSAGPTLDPELFDELEMTEVEPSVWTELMKNVPNGDIDNDLPGWMHSWRLLNGSVAFDEAMAEQYTENLYRGDPRNAQVADNHIHAVTTLPDDLPQRLRSVDAPLLVLHGSEDPLVPISHGRALADLVPEAQFHRIERAGHMFFDSAIWREISNAWQDFVR